MIPSNRRRMIDVSSNNGRLDVAAHWKAGHRLLMRKVTEGTSYIWREGAALASAWHRRGGIMWHYAYLRAGIPGRAQADFFWRAAKADVRHYDRVVADVEAQFETYRQWQPGEAARCFRDFADRMHELAPHLAGVTYGPPYFLKDAGVRPVHGWGLQVADYDGPVDLLPSGWKSWLAHQFTQTGHAAGIAGEVDISQLRLPALRPTLAAGDRCFAVVDAKHLLRRAGYRGFLLSSNYYGSGFRRAVAKYKRDHRFANKSGAVFGRQMWRHLS